MIPARHRGTTQASETDEVTASSRDTTPPPADYTEARRRGWKPPPKAEDRQLRIDSDALTLPSSYAIPRLTEPVELPYYLVDRQTGALMALVDGLRTIAEIARLCGMVDREAQLRFADLRDHGVVSLE